jgi:predicted GNAT family acetyltransferase
VTIDLAEAGRTGCWMDATTAKTDLQVQHEETSTGGAFFVTRDGMRLGELVYTRRSEDLVNIDHTEVDPALRGQGVARKLLDAAVAWARQSGTRVKATCRYARGQFESDASIKDVYAG